MEHDKSIHDEPLDQQILRLEAVQEEVTQVIKEVYVLCEDSENLTIEASCLAGLVLAKLRKLRKFRNELAALQSDEDTEPSNQNSAAKSKKSGKIQPSKFGKTRRSKNAFVAELDQIIAYVEQIAKNLEGKHAIDQAIIGKLMLTHIGQAIQAEAYQKLVTLVNEYGINSEKRVQYKDDSERNLVLDKEFDLFKQFSLQVLIPYYSDCKTHPFLCHCCYCIYYVDKVQETKCAFYLNLAPEKEKTRWKKLMTPLGDIFRTEGDTCLTTKEKLFDFLQENLICADSILCPTQFTKCFTFKDGQHELGKSKMSEAKTLKWPFVKIPVPRTSSEQKPQHECTRRATRRAETDIKKLIEETKKRGSIFNPIGGDDYKPKSTRNPALKAVSGSERNNSEEPSINQQQPSKNPQDAQPQPGQSAPLTRQPPMSQLTTLGGMFGGNQPTGTSAYADQFKNKLVEESQSQPYIEGASGEPGLGKRVAEQPEQTGPQAAQSMSLEEFIEPDEDSDLELEQTTGMKFTMDHKGAVVPIDLRLPQGVAHWRYLTVEQLLKASGKLLIHFKKEADMPARWLEVDTPTIKDLLFLADGQQIERLEKQAKKGVPIFEELPQNPNPRAEDKAEARAERAAKRRGGFSSLTRQNNPAKSTPKASSKIDEETDH
jgi:hypothetical protein